MKTILLTGASSGIGLAIAEHLTALGHRVFGASRRPGPSTAVQWVALDLQSPESIQACVQTVLAEAGQLDVLINNAGFLGPMAAAEEVDIATLRAVLETNFFGTVQLTNAVLPHFRAQRRGQIITVSSMGGRVAFPPFCSAYVASKHALEGYTESLASEVAPFGIRVALVEPGYFQTNIHHTTQPPDHPIADYALQREHVARFDDFGLLHGRDPQLVAAYVAHLVAQPPTRLRHPVGMDARWMALFLRWFPEPLLRWWLKEMLGGQPLRASDDDTTLRRKIGYRATIFDAPIYDALTRRVLTGFLAGSLVAAGLWAVRRLARPRKAKAE